MHDIFLSYASEDRERVRPLVERLEEHGWSVWWDREIPPGQTWTHMIADGLAATKAMIVVWSEVSVKSEWVEIEATKGKERGGLIPVAIDPVETPLQFSLLQAADLTAWDHSPDDREVRKLIDELEKVLGAPLPVSSPRVERKPPAPTVSPDAELGSRPRRDFIPASRGAGFGPALSEPAKVVPPITRQERIRAAIAGGTVGSAIGLSAAAPYALGEPPLLENLIYGLLLGVGASIAGLIVGNHKASVAMVLAAAAIGGLFVAVWVSSGVRESGVYMLFDGATLGAPVGCVLGALFSVILRRLRVKGWEA